MKRLHLLCEDRRTERFVRALCERYELRLEKIEIAPSGEGSVEAWVRRRYAEFVRRARALRHQLGLQHLVVLDGDGAPGSPASARVQLRQKQLAEALHANGITRRADDERIAHFVPTWSIETWLIHLAEGRSVPEDRPLKGAGEYRESFADYDAERITLERAAQAWKPAAPTSLDSLRAAYAEALRIQLA